MQRASIATESYPTAEERRLPTAVPAARLRPLPHADRRAGSGSNDLLRALPASEHSLLSGHLERVRLSRSAVLQGCGGGATHVFFPESAVAAVMLGLDQGARSSEIMAIGHEGMVGLSLFLTGRCDGAQREEIVISVPGEALRLEAEAFRTLIDELPTLKAVLGRYTESLLSRIAYTALCGRQHSLEQRLATLLLLMRDRVADDRVPITHRQLAGMLGVRRAGVTESAGRLRDAGAIQYTRGAIAVDDPVLLERYACCCYRIQSQLSHVTAGHVTPA